MVTKPLDRFMFAQGGLCFFCKKPLSQSEASVEHLVASANGGNNHDDNCVVCCKALNSLFGRMSLKEKIQVILNQRGQFACPGSGRSSKSASHASKSLSEKLDLIVADLHKRGAARPRTVTTLSSTISALFQKHLSEAEVSALVEQLRARGVVSIAGAKVTYALPPKVA